MGRKKLKQEVLQWVFRLKEWTPILTEKETVMFDLKGYILFPAVLSEDEIAPIKAQCEKLRTDKRLCRRKRVVCRVEPHRY